MVNEHTPVQCSGPEAVALELARQFARRENESATDDSIYARAKFLELYAECLAVTKGNYPAT